MTNNEPAAAHGAVRMPVQVAEERRAGVRAYAAVTASYWAFTLTDGALRMLVLLHFHRLGYSPFTLAALFLLYEAAGVVSNLIGGWLATRHGIARMLAVGLLAQCAGFALLASMSPDWAPSVAVLWVVLAQGVCGVAKDLTKTASKAAIRHTAVDGGARLFRWVAWFTGSKNAMKGAGFFLGGALLQAFGFHASLWAMAAALLLVWIAVVAHLPSDLGKGKPSKRFAALFAKTPAINLLALARVLLFGARDVWFVVALPVYLYAASWSFSAVGAFLACWTIAYGVVQTLAPRLVRGDDLPLALQAARRWAGVLAVVPAVLAAFVAGPMPDATWVVVAGLGVFGVLFAVNSSVHSFLILAFAGSEKVAEDVGFYYAANAVGRFLGTLLSGLLFQWGGLSLALAVAAAMLVLCWLVTLRLRAVEATAAA